MGEKYKKYRSAKYQLPHESWAWNLYGAGMENMGNHGKPEPFSIPEPNDDQLLVRIDSVGVCFSDVKDPQAGRQSSQTLQSQFIHRPNPFGARSISYDHNGRKKSAEELSTRSAARCSTRHLSKWAEYSVWLYYSRGIGPISSYRYGSIGDGRRCLSPSSG